MPRELVELYALLRDRAKDSAARSFEQRFASMQRELSDLRELVSA